MDDAEKSLKYLFSVEKLAEDILADRRALVLLDKSRNENREALRHLRSSQAGNKCWVTVAANFVKCPSAKAVLMIEDDQKKIEAEINKIRDELKVKVNSMRDMELKPPVPGLGLTPLSQKENAALKNKLY